MTRSITATFGADAALFARLLIKQAQIDFRIIHIHTNKAHFNLVTEPVTAPAMFAGQTQPSMLQMVIIVAQAGHVHQSFNE